MTTARRALEVVAPGFTFCPRPKDLIDVYLRRKIAGEPLPGATARFIHEVDVYSAEPEQLARAYEKAPGTGKGDKQPVWYFFSRVRHRHAGGSKKNARGGAARRSRTIENVVGKHWHSESQAKPVPGGSAVGGYRHFFSYKVKNGESGKDVRGGWIMYEYGISEEHKGGDLVLCEIHPSPNKEKQEAAAMATATAVRMSGPTISSKKRKASAGRHPEDTTASTRPRPMVDQDQHPTMVESLGSAAAMMKTEDADDYHRHTGADETLLDATELDNLRQHTAFEEGREYCWYGGDPDTAAAQVQLQEMDDNLFDNVNVDGLYPNNVVMAGPGGYLAMMPAAQTEVQEMNGSFLDNMDGLYQNNVAMAGPGGYLAMVPAAQPEVREMDGSFFDNVDGVYQNNVVLAGPGAPGGDLAMAPAAHQPEGKEMEDDGPSPNNFLHNLMVEEDVNWYEVGGNYSDEHLQQLDAAPAEDNMEQDIPSLHHNDDHSATPPEAQPEVEEEATGLAQSITADGNDEHRHPMEEGTQPEREEPAADEPIYGLPCPDFSPEMIRLCSRMPWPSPTSLAAILSGL